MMYSSNELWLELTNVDLTGQVADLLLHNTSSSYYYQLLNKTNLLQPVWTLGESIQAGATGTNETPFQGEYIGVNSNMFFWAHQAQWYVSVSATTAAFEPSGNIPGKTGTFTVTGRPISGVTNPLTVYYRVSGTASNGADYSSLYSSLYGTVMITNGSDATIEVVPVADSFIEGTETIILTVIPTNTYLITARQDSDINYISDSSTTIRIDADSPDDLAFEPNGPAGVPARNGRFTLYRSDLQNIYTNLAVRYVISGTASNGVDYVSLTNVVNFLPGPSASTTNIDIIPQPDIFQEGIETVTLTLVVTNTYLIEAGHSNATVFIDDTSTKVSVTAATRPLSRARAPTFRVRLVPSCSHVRTRAQSPPIWRCGMWFPARPATAGITPT